MGWIMTVSQILGYWGELEKLGLNTLSHVQRHMKSLQLLISYQMRAYFSVKTLCELSYTCFTGTRVWKQFGEIRLGYPKSGTETHEK